jgi:2-methylcitrate dehydratase PrpD
VVAAGDGPEPLTRDMAACLARSAAVSSADLDDEATRAVRMLVFDALGVAVPWLGARLGLGDAAAALSWLIHAWDFDDTNDPAVLHCGAVAVAAAYATGLEAGASGEQFLAGVVAGVEVMSRVSLALGFQDGVIRTSGLAGIGAAAAAARVLGLDAAGFANAVALAAPFAMAPASRQVLADGGETKRLQPGFGVRDGVESALLAAGGLVGPAGWFGGEFGLARRSCDPDAALAALATPGWEVTRLSIKPFPSCRFTHSSVAGALRLVDAGLPAAEIDAIRVRVPTGHQHATVARPWGRRTTPLNDSQFSIPWMVAAALTVGRADLDMMAGPMLTDTAIEDLARRVAVTRDVAADPSGLTPVHLTVTERTGAEHRLQVDSAPGGPEHPLGWDMLTDKVRGCLRAAALPPVLADDLRAWVLDLDASPMTPAPTTASG